MMRTFEKCIQNRRIFKSDFVLKRVETEILDAKDDLKTAKKAYKDSNYKWATIQAYYSIFHAARSLLYSKGYGEKGHYCLYIAIKELFVKQNILEEEYAEFFLNGMMLRENADYKRTYSVDSALAVINGAEKFIIKASQLLKEGVRI